MAPKYLASGRVLASGFIQDGPGLLQVQNALFEPRVGAEVRKLHFAALMGVGGFRGVEARVTVIIHMAYRLDTAFGSQWFLRGKCLTVVGDELTFGDDAGIVEVHDYSCERRTGTLRFVAD